MATLANIYAANNCKVPIFSHEDKKWHVSHTIEGKWVDETFINPDMAYDYYLDLFHSLEKEYELKNKGKGSR